MQFRGLAVVSLCLLLLTGASPAQQTSKRLEPGWTKWAAEDVAYIITGDELRAFTQLGADDEREQFAEQFWLRRDPTPDTIENEYKEEHYRRIAYANQHFASGVSGWKTDRGRLYIRFGPPDEIDSHPSGGSFQRPSEQGGGVTSVYPFETWRYRHLDNVGEDIVVEFVDPTMSGEYRMTIDPCEKDALKFVPGAAPSQTGQPGVRCGSPGAAVSNSAGQNQFERLRIQSDLERPPSVKFRDLEALIDTRVTFNVLPMAVRVDYLRITDASVLANVTVQFENKDLQFQGKDGVEKSAVNLFGRVVTMTRRPVATFEKPLEIVAPTALLPQYARQSSVFQQSIPLAPGRYKLNLVAKDLVSGNVANMELTLEAPHFDDEHLAASSLILADTIQTLATKNVGGGMFAIGDRKVRPRVNGQFSRDEKMGVYMQVYNPGKASGTVSYRIEKTGTNETPVEFTEPVGDIPHASASQITIEKLLPLQSFTSGGYILRLRVDTESQHVEREVPFTIAP